MPAVMRILDANANRAREAVRVMEDAARFILDDGALAASLKQFRHDLSRVLSTAPTLIDNRDTPGDVGTTIKTEQELQRDSVADVVAAAGRRLGEALRTLEEYGKTVGQAAVSGGVTSVGGGGFARTIESLRYRGYELHRRLDQALSTSRAGQWRVCVLLSENLCPGGDWQRVAEAVINQPGDKGEAVDCIQLREKSLDAGRLLERAQWLVALCRPRGVAVVVNDRPDVAVLAGADGVHLGQTDLTCRHVRKLFGRQLLVGVSTSNMDQAKQAQRDGADYCGLGPVFATATKPKALTPGPDYLREYLAWGRLPHLAIGGVCPANVGQLVDAGVMGVAVSRAVCAATDPAAVVAELSKALRR